MKVRNFSKTTRSNLITYGMVIVAYIIVEIFLRAGMVSSLIEGLLVPLCVYVILAVSLNLTVGISGELSRYPCTASEGRLSGYCNAGFR